MSSSFNLGEDAILVTNQSTSINRSYGTCNKLWTTYRKPSAEYDCRLIMVGSLVEFYGISNVVGYLTPNPFYGKGQFYFKIVC